MFKFLTFICMISLVLSERPDWYPENPNAIEAECTNKYSISAETVEKIRAYQIEDTPAIRSALLCSAVGKNIYRPEFGFEPERYVIGIKYGLNVDCKVEYISGCAQKYMDIESQEEKYFKFFKCVIENRKDNCKKIE
ncbi:uncharacterized protein [Musca autumnalis]|uniref:uncharacterized protein n=1 Tax=Musca autumnalis TaxID=221902 RepID=UPI003CF9359D